MSNAFRKLTVTLVIAVLAFSLAAAPALAAAQDGSEQRSADAMVGDALILRPLGLVASVFGAGVWVVSLPFSLIAGNTGEVGDKLVGAPLRYTFKRPLGQIDK